MSGELSVRLTDVFDTAVEGKRGIRLIDVGSDHGHLALHALKTGAASEVICTDIHEAPAQRTERCLAEAGFSQVSRTFCTDGLQGIHILPGDVIVMAGLGGNNMIDIMKEVIPRTGDEVLSEVTWCLQPQKSAELIREFLSFEGFAILEEKVSAERGFYYPILKTSYDGVRRELTPREKYYGPVLVRKFKEKDPSVIEYFLRLDDRYKIRARGDTEVRKMLEDLK